VYALFGPVLIPVIAAYGPSPPRSLTAGKLAPLEPATVPPTPAPSALIPPLPFPLPLFPLTPAAVLLLALALPAVLLMAAAAAGAPARVVSVVASEPVPTLGALFAPPDAPADVAPIGTAPVTA